MLPLLCLQPQPASLFFIQSITYPLHHRHSFTYCKSRPRLRRRQFCVSSISNDPSRFNQTEQQNQQPRTLFPGGFKRAEIKVPNVVLQVDVDEVLGGGSVLDLVDDAVSKWVGIVVLDGSEGSGGKLYEAACLLKSRIKDRAYLLVAERVDIAAAVNASGVLLSDQGLPAIVARNMMLESKSESVVLPLVARTVKSAEAALNASSSEGGDFLIYDIGEDSGRIDEAVNSLFDSVKIPIFISFASCREAISVGEASKFLIPCASGLAFSVGNLGLLGDGVISKLISNVFARSGKMPDENGSFKELNRLLGNGDDSTTLRNREKQFIERERSVLLKAIKVIQKAAPLMEEVSLLADAVSRLNEPFLLAIVGEFNSGKSTVINALLGNRYLSEGVIPTTNEITFLRYSDLKSVGSQRCERNVDGQYVCFLPAPILKEMNMVDTPGTNVILQRQQRLTEEFVPRADLLLFVLSADRPLTESEVTFLQYIQQWKKRIVFVLNKSDIYQNARELEEAISFIKENAKKLLNTEHITIYPVSARATLEGKLGPLSCRTGSGLLTNKNPSWKFNTFLELEEFLHSFLDSSTSNGMERIRLKLETPVAIAERLLSSCEKLVRQDSQRMKQNLTSIKDLVSSVAEYAAKMDGQSISYRRQILSLIDTTKSRILEQVESTVQLSNFDTVASYIFKGEKSSMMPITSKVLNDIIGPALSDTQKLLEDYVVWLKSNNTREGRLYKEAFEERWQSLANPVTELHLDAYEMLKEVDELSLRAMSNFNAVATSKSLEREIREVFLGTFGGLGAAGLSASLLTSVLPTTLEDLLALGISSAGGLLAISRFPAQRRELEEKVKKAADALASDLEEAMEKDLLQAIGNLENFVKTISKPYEDVAQNRLDKLLEIQDGLSNIQKELQTLQIEIQNFHVS